MLSAQDGLILVVHHTGVSLSMLRSESRIAQVTYARHLAAYVLYAECGLTYAQVAYYLQRRHHTTALNSCAVVTHTPAMVSAVRGFLSQPHPADCPAMACQEACVLLDTLASPSPYVLNRHEAAVLRLICFGADDAEIEQTYLAVDVPTLRSITHRLYGFARTDNRVKLVLWAFSHDLAPYPPRRSSSAVVRSAQQRGILCPEMR